MAGMRSVYGALRALVTMPSVMGAIVLGAVWGTLLSTFFTAGCGISSALVREVVLFLGKFLWATWFTFLVMNRLTQSTPYTFLHAFHEWFKRLPKLWWFFLIVVGLATLTTVPVEDERLWHTTTGLTLTLIAGIAYIAFLFIDLFLLPQLVSASSARRALGTSFKLVGKNARACIAVYGAAMIVWGCALVLASSAEGGCGLLFRWANAPETLSALARCFWTLLPEYLLTGLTIMAGGILYLKNSA